MHQLLAAGCPAPLLGCIQPREGVCMRGYGTCQCMYCQCDILAGSPWVNPLTGLPGQTPCRFAQSGLGFARCDHQREHATSCCKPLHTRPSRLGPAGCEVDLCLSSHVVSGLGLCVESHVRGVCVQEWQSPISAGAGSPQWLVLGCISLHVVRGLKQSVVIQIWAWPMRSVCHPVQHQENRHVDPPTATAGISPHGLWHIVNGCLLCTQDAQLPELTQSGALTLCAVFPLES